jgi:hypothetical protein
MLETTAISCGPIGARADLRALKDLAALVRAENVGSVTECDPLTGNTVERDRHVDFLDVAASSILSRSNRIGHGCAAGAQGLWPAGGGVADRLMLGFCV